MTDITVEQGELFTSVWGDTIYDENAEFFIDAPITVTVSGASSVLEGDNTMFSASIFPSVNGHFEWSLPTQVDGVSVDSKTGVLTTTERGLDNYNMVVRATFIFDNGDAPVSGDASIEVVKRTYPEGVSIIGDGELTENTSFTWEYSNDGVNGDYDIVWSLLGTIATYYEVAKGDNDGCILKRTLATIPDTVSGTLQMEVIKRVNGEVVASNKITIAHTVVWMQDATIIGNANPLIYPMEYTWETTTQGVNGDYYAEWSLEGDVTSVVKIKTQTNDKCTLEVLNVVTEVVQGAVTLTLRKQYDNSIIVTATKTLAAVMEGVVITSVTNPGVQAALYNAGLVANESYSLKEEVEKITAEQLQPGTDSTTSIFFSQRINIRNFDEFEYFTNVNKIKDYTFYSCIGLQNITIPNSLTEIGYCAFTGCTNLTSITIPDSVTEIGERAFYSCTSLTSVNIPDSVTTIGSQAFYRCRNLTSIAIPNSVTSIKYGTFYDCSSLTSITIPDSVTSIENYAFYVCTSLTSITIPKSVTSIGNGVFQSCSSLTSITIPEGVTSIGEWTFGYCSSLISITIPNGVKIIKECAFYGCSNLETFISKCENAPTVNSNAFGNSDSSYTGRNTYNTGENMLYVPIDATGYDARYWLDPLQNAEKCGFTISYSL